MFSPVAPQSYYQVLGVAESADRERIRAAVRERVKRHHPDRGGDPGTFRLIVRARETLLDPQRRRAYDEHLRERRRIRRRRLPAALLAKVRTPLVRLWRVGNAGPPSTRAAWILSIFGMLAFALGGVFAGAFLFAAAFLICLLLLPGWLLWRTLRASTD